MRANRRLVGIVSAAGMLACSSPSLAQDAAAPPRSAAQQLIHDAANGRPIRQPESMNVAGPVSAWDRQPYAPVPLASEHARAATGTATAAVDVDSAIESRVAALRPGRYLWMPERRRDGEVAIVVSLAEQMAYAYRGGTLIGVSTVSTGMDSHPTPTGSFTILQKRRQHFSNLYDNAPMPNMQRLTWDGIALHAGAIPGRPASHGCIRLPMAFSNHLFAVTALGGRVHIIGESPPSAEGALAYATNDGTQSASR